jgi:hypothetical protein
VSGLSALYLTKPMAAIGQHPRPPPLALLFRVVRRTGRRCCVDAVGDLALRTASANLTSDPIPCLAELRQLIGVVLGQVVPRILQPGTNLPGI